MKLAISLLSATAFSIGLASAATAADLIIDEPAIVAPAISGGNWDGLYLGAFIGAGWGFADHTNSGFDVDGADADLSGWLVGAKAGANFTIGSGIVAGLVGDIAWSDISGTYESAPVIGDSTVSINWQGSLRGILGVDAGAFMPYLTGGLAVANATHEVEFFEPELSVDETLVGWTVGAGVEVAVADNMSLNLEYRYSDYGSATFDHGSPFDPPDFDITSHQVTAGINFRF